MENIPPNSEIDVLLSVNMTKVSEAGGILFGKVTLATEGKNYLIPYAASSFTHLNISVVGTNVSLYPDICLHDDNISFYKFVSQGWEITGNNYTSLVSADKNYSVYAIGDWENYSLMYILIGRVYVPTQGASIVLNISETRPFTVMVESVGGSEIEMYEWIMGFITYKNTNLRPFGETISYINMFTGNQTVYLSNKPDSDLDTDIEFKYSGIPVRK